MPVQLPIHTPTNNPATQQPSSNGHPAQNSPGTTPPNQDQPAPLSQGRSLQEIRDSLNHAPYGLLTPDPAHQQALADAVPRNEDGTPQRHPDPNGEWAQLQNDGGLQEPGRSNNCLDNARAGLSTWFGDPQVSAPRTPDQSQDGTPDRISPERDSYNNLDAWAGRPQIWAGADHPNPYGRIAQHLQEAGPGSAAVVGVQWPGGGGHAFNVYNHNGNIIWVDHQTGEVSPNPIHTGAAGVRYVPFDPDGQTMDAPWEKKQDTEKEGGQNQNQNQGQNQNQNQGPATSNTEPDSAPATPSTPTAGYGAAQPEGAATPTPEQSGSAPTTAQPKPHADDAQPRVHRERPGEGLLPLQPGDEQRVEARREREAVGARERLGKRADEAEQRFEQAKQAGAPQAERDRLEDRAKELRDQANAVQPRKFEDDERTELPPDAAQDRLRETNPVYRIDHEKVDGMLDAWAQRPDEDSLSPLAQVLRTAANQQDHKDAAPHKPTTFTRDGLARALPGFDQLNRGEQMHVVSTMARLSQAVHHEYGVGNNPGKSSKNPVRGLKSRREKVARPIQDEVIKAGLKGSRHVPDVRGVNYAVIEVRRGDDVEYVVDSSVPKKEGVSDKQRHSEDHLLDWIEERNNQLQEGEPKFEIQRLYTEREPCGVDKGARKGSNCSDLLGRRIPGIPIYYSTAYRAHESRAQERLDYRSENLPKFKEDNGLPEGPALSQKNSNAFKRQVDDAVPASRQEMQMEADFKRHIQDKTRDLWRSLADQLK
ncbi:toxin glutamine deamidase domain-containing protein [Streptomyces sp. BH055]|uniref:toxin glutamine deamidase domain-containing protein n=1 Tax=Streptomyces sp. BH055 TaxID=3401173 RepID=UPI003BB5AFD4